MATYKLDLTNVKALPSWWPSDVPKVIVLEDGTFNYPYQVVASKNEPGLIVKLKLALKNNMPSYYERMDKVMPIGVDGDRLPSGATLEEAHE